MIIPYQKNKQREKSSAMPKIKTIAITGGACSGKTTLLNKLKEQGKTFCGYRMLYIPEAATMLTNSNVCFENDPYEYQKAILNTQLSLENIFAEYAKSLKSNTCIISDRGTLDGAAYLGDEQFNELLNEVGISKQQLSGKYDGVLYLVSAAIGAEEHYGDATNATRRENLEEAIKLEQATLNCWKDHNNIYIVDNENDKTFSSKISEAMQDLEKLLRS